VSDTSQIRANCHVPEALTPDNYNGNQREGIDPIKQRRAEGNVAFGRYNASTGVIHGILSPNRLRIFQPMDLGADCTASLI
jgi:hypothetical protein